MVVKIKRIDDNAIFPIRGTKGSAGMDLTAISITTEVNESGEIILVYHTGLSIEIPEGYMGILLPRSSICKKPMSMCNAVGLIDSDFRGEITAKFRTTVPVVPSVYQPGERICQLLILPVPDVQFEESETLSETDRGEGGYGSTDEQTSSAPSATQSLPETEGEPINSEPATDGSGDAANSVEEA